MIGRLERVPLRNVWPHEALDFTCWLETNYEILNDVLDINLASAQREQSAGVFSVDLVAEDESGNAVVIENQLERSDHDHLGKLLTYLANLEARTAIWIVADPRSEHVRAISWLNETSPAAFYMVKAEAVRIGDSLPAPLLTVIVGPSEESREIGKTKTDLAEQDIMRREFWEQLLERASSRTSLHASSSPTTKTWVSTGAGHRGLGFTYVANQYESRVELYIDRGKGHDDENKAIFDQFYQKRDQIEAQFGASLNWQRLDERRASRVSYPIAIGGYRDEGKWPEIQEAMVDAMVRLEGALRPHIDRLAI